MDTSTNTESYEEFEGSVIAQGALPYDRGNGHWQVKTKLCTLNYYPWSSRKTIFMPAVPGFVDVLTHEGADVATVIRLVQEIKAKEKKYASANNPKKRLNSIR